MKRKANVSNKAQHKASRAADRSSGRAGVRSAEAKSAKQRQQGNPLQHSEAAVHYNMTRAGTRRG